MGYKILHLDTERSWRGGERQLSFLLEYMNKKKFKHFVACRPGTAMEKKAKEMGAVVLPLSPFAEVDPFSVVKIRRFIKNERIDLVHAHTSHTVGLGALSLFRVDVPFVAHRRVDFRTGRDIYSAYKYKRADRIVAVSGAIKDVLTNDGFERDKISVIYSGVDLTQYDKIKKLDLRSKYGIPESCIIAGMVTALAPHKDIFNFLGAFSFAVKSGSDLYGFIVGEGKLRSELEAKRNELGLKDRVVFTGFKDNPLEWLAGFDIFVISSYLEGLGTTVLDAMGLGMPVAATRAGGIPEMIEDEKTGLLAAPGNEEALGQVIKRMAEDKSLRERLSNAAVERVKHFSIKNTVKLTEDLYKELIR